jgi:phage terminase large subunit-like protein
VIFDELHAIEDRELIDVLQTSTGARKEPLIISITTAGFDQTSICYEKYQYACKVRDGVIQDVAVLPAVYQAGEEEEWTSVETWKRCNPNFQVSISEEYLSRECERAKESPAFEAVFKRLHLNLWTEAESPYIRLEDWDRCGGPLPDLTGRKCYGGLDLSRSDDLTAFSLCFFPEGDDPFYLLSWGCIPEEAMIKQRRRPYFQWVQQGHLIKIPGAVIEYSFVIEKILQLKKQYDIQAIMFDRWGSTTVYQALENEGLEMIEHGQGFKDMSPPTKELHRLILSQKIRHDGNPVLRWCISNLVVETDAAGNVKPSKKRSTEKIDSVVSSVMALQGCLLSPGQEEESVYEHRGLLIM